MSRLEAAITPRTRALFINTPSNPTGWAATRETLSAILELARRHGGGDAPQGAAAENAARRRHPARVGCSVNPQQHLSHQQRQRGATYH